VPAASNAFRLREYRPGDFDSIWEIDQACYERAIAYSRRELRDYLRFPGAECVTAEIAGEIAGFLVTAHDRATGYIVTVDVLPAHRRQGVATLMLAEAERRLAAAGVRVVELETAIDNTPAIAFWEKHGYRTCGLKKQYYANGRDALTMKKLLG